MGINSFCTDRSTDRPYWYVYAVISASDQLFFTVSGVDGEETDVYTLGEEGIALVVSRTARSNYQGLERQEAVRYLAQHQRVVETVMHDGYEVDPPYTVLPVKFGTVLPDKERLQQLLKQGKNLFEGRLKALAHQEQMEVVVLWELDKVFQAIGNEPEIVAFKTQAAGLAGQELNTARMLLGQIVKARLDQRRESLQARIAPALRAVTRDSVVNPLLDDKMVLNLALLMEREHLALLEERLNELDEQFSGSRDEPPLFFRCVGPLPPYSFATVEISVPSSGVIDAARKQLELGAMATFNEIKQAYRRLAAQVHPDLHPEVPDAQTQMTLLTQAYQILSSYAEGQGMSWIGQGETAAFPCDFRQEAVEQTLLVTIRQPDMPIE